MPANWAVYARRSMTTIEITATAAQRKPNRSRMSSAWPRPVPIASRAVISWTRYSTGTSATMGRRIA